MSLPIPDLDDISFDDLMKEARALIPVYDKEWTNYNPSDPGITLLELFSWLCELVIYRINQVPDVNYGKFLKLLAVDKTIGSGKISSNGKDVIGYQTLFAKELKIGYSITFIGPTKSEDQTRRILNIDSDTFLTVNSAFDPELPPETEFYYSKSIDEGICEGLEVLSRRYRAITTEDYEYLAMECMETLQKGLTGRVICVNNRDLEYRKNENSLQPGHISVIIIPRCNESSPYCSDGLPTEDLKKEIKNYLDTRKLVTTRLHVVEPDYQKVKLEVWVSSKENILDETTRNKIKNEIQTSIKTYFDPIKGGQNSKGWSPGRDVYRSEIFKLLEGIKGVDHGVKVKINNLDENFKIERYQLVLLDPDPIVNIQ